MRLSPDDMIFWQHGYLKLNGTIVFTWALMFVLAVGSKLVTRNLSTELKRSRWQNSAGDRCHRHREANRRCRPPPPKEVYRSLGEGRAVATALSSLAQQPDSATTITRTLFVGLAMIESIAIYCFVVSMILIFANPFWNHVIAQTPGK